jgi:2-keto-4-pentenoate hydratase/2-oxohepta-3-ene-1,7-dioic acid hydratase in catechol pathway
MKICTYRHDGRTRAGFIDGSYLIDAAVVLSDPRIESVIDLLAAVDGCFDVAALGKSVAAVPGATRLPLESVTLLAPVPQPGKIIGVGRNYRAHAEEVALPKTSVPKLFFKFANSVVGHGAPVTLHEGVTKLDYEVELGVIIGKRARYVSRDRALDCVAGYTIMNDLSARDFQFDKGDTMTSFSKAMDGFCPIGPWMVARDAMPEAANSRLRCWINGDLRQDASTSEMIYDTPALIEHITRYMTLEAGDCIATGTPAGIAMMRKPPPWLKPGDRMRMEIDGIGVLENVIRAP